MQNKLQSKHHASISEFSNYPSLCRNLEKKISQSFMNAFYYLNKKHDLVTTQTLKNSLEKP